MAFPDALSDAQEPRFLSGTMLQHYELMRPLGKGGMGEVYVARDTRLGRLVAIKFLLEHSGPAADRLIVEARTTARCRHDNIVVIYDVGEYDGFPYIVLEYIEGQSLRAAMAERGKGMSALAVDVMLPVVRALDCAHAMGIVHRDLKPENILLSDSGQIKVLDFGIAKEVYRDTTFEKTSASGPVSIKVANVVINNELAQTVASTVTVREAQFDELAMTQEGMLMGTMPYMSPEQWLGETIDARSDIWAAGIILFELCTGKHPLDPISTARLAQVVDLNTPMPSIRDKQPDAGSLIDIIERCLEKHKDQRWASAKELVAALERVGAEKQLASVRGDDESPFAGLSAFQKSDAIRFFGREHDIAASLGKLRNQQLLVIAGPSGAGKSSFVRAGVLPALERAGRDLETFVVRPGRHPLAALADVLAFFQDTGAAVDDANSELIVNTLRTQPGHLGARFRARCRRRGAEHRIVLFVDQLEELYTLGIDPAERAAFCACLEGVADDASSPLRVIATIRADFLDRLSDDRKFLAEVTRGLLFLPPMTRDGLRGALTKPLETIGYRFEDEELVAEMLDGLTGTTAPLPILQFTGAKLWETRDTDRRLLTRDAYRALGGVAGALSTHADAVLASLSLPEQGLARTLFMALVTPERTRAIVRLDELVGLVASSAAVEQVVDHLANARLILIDAASERDGKTVELTHESLIARWGKLKLWLDENEQDAQFLGQLRSAAQQWEKNGEGEGFLWRDRAAQDAASWLERRKTQGTMGIAKREQRYIEAVIDFAERTRKWKVRIAATLFAAISLTALIVSVLAIRAREQALRADAEKAEAQAQRTEALRSALHARNATRMAAARELQEKDPTTALVLLRELESKDVPPGWAELADGVRRAGVAPVVFVNAGRALSASFSPDGKRIVAASFDNMVRIWNADGTGEPLVLRGHDETVHAVSWSPDGKRIASGAGDKTIRVWNADGSGSPTILRGHESHVSSVAFSPDGKRIVSGSWDTTIRVTNADDSGTPIVLRGHDKYVYSVVFSPDGRHIASGSLDNTIRVWNADGSGRPLVMGGHDGGIHRVAYSPDGRRLVSASEDKTVRVWNADGSGQPLVFEGHTSDVGSAVFSPDGTRIASASDDRTIRIWKVDHSASPLILRGHDSIVRSVNFDSEGNRVVSASFDSTMRVWNVRGATHSIILRGHDAAVSAASFSHDGKRIVSASSDKTVRIWDADGSGNPFIFRGHIARVNSTAFSPDGQRIASASDDNDVRVWNADGTGQSIVLHHGTSVLGVDWSPDGRRIVTACIDQIVRVWNADGSGEPLLLRGHEGPVLDVSFSRDGQRIISYAPDKTVRVWNANGSGLPLVIRHDVPAAGAAFSPDGLHIVTAAVDNVLRLWNADGSGEPILFRGHTALPFVAGIGCCSPDSKRFVSCSRDGMVRVWNTDELAKTLVLHVSPDAVNMASFSPDGKRIAAASDNKTITVWSDLEPLLGPDDPRLWAATNDCLSMDVRQRLLGFTDEQSRIDLERCEKHISQ